MRIQLQNSVLKYTAYGTKQVSNFLDVGEGIVNGLSYSEVAAAQNIIGSNVVTAPFIRKISEFYKPVVPGAPPAGTFTSAGITLTTAFPPAFVSPETVVYHRWDDQNAFRWLTGQPEGVNGNPGLGCVTRTTGATNNQTQTVSFIYTGKHLVFNLTSFGTSNVAVYVDNQRAFYGYANGENVYNLSIPFAEYGTHQIEINFGLTVPFVSISQPTDKIRKGPERMILGLMGDSYTDIGQNPDFGGLSLELFEKTGFAIYGLGQGSTGWVFQNDTVTLSKEPYGGPKRIQAVKNANLDLLLILGSVNDGATNALVGEKVTQFLDAIPNIPTVVAGVEHYGGGNNGYAYNNNLVRTSALSNRNLGKNCLGFIDWYEEQWQTGTGNVTTPVGNGNQDFIIGADLIHANLKGNRMFGAQFAAALGQIDYVSE